MIPKKLSLEQWSQVHQRLADAQDEALMFQSQWSDWMWTSAFAVSQTLHLEDVSGIPFVNDVPGVEQYQHRARVRAWDKDLFASVTPAAAGYEEYCQRHLGLGAPELLLAEAGPVLTQVTEACSRGAAFERLVEVTRARGGLCIPIWLLSPCGSWRGCCKSVRARP